MFRWLEIVLEPVIRIFPWPWPWPCLSCPPEVGNPLEEIFQKMFG